MRIGLVHFRSGEKDGVSLEMEKWETVLRRRGHDVKYVSGSLGGKAGYEIPEMTYDAQENAELHEHCFSELKIPESELKRRIEEYSDSIEKRLLRDFEEWQPELLIVNNIWSLGHNLAAAMAIRRSVEKSGIRAVGVHHDFYWERKRFANPTCDFVEQLLHENCPPSHVAIEHVTINSLAQKELQDRKNLESRVIPNVFYFDQEPWERDAFNMDMRSRLHIGETDLVFLQATRIVERKAIEMAIDFVSYFSKVHLDGIRGKTLYNGRSVDDHSRAIICLAGSPEQESMDYNNRIHHFALARDVRLVDAYEIVNAVRSLVPEKRYGLWDAYTMADFFTYTSVIEGWGNQFLEAIFARLPVIVFEYPVFKNDIAPLGFWTFSLGDQFSEHNELLHVPQERIEQEASKFSREIVRRDFVKQKLSDNFEIGSKHLSLKALEKHLLELLKY
ncbi:MAG TPA: glycosyl transferase family 1 [Kosmotogaceae bacterium]|nr:glycosyl transferase family 1 [Kosmotogaceae bacterium]